MIGVILCGGQSLRMGKDKGLLKLQATTWAQTAIDKISFLNLRVVLSVNDTQYNSYAEIFGKENLVADDSSLAIKGPLAGLLNVHEKFAGEDLLVLACDMPLMETSLVQKLFDSYNNNDAAAYLFINEGEPEPLCAIYRSEALDETRNLYDSGKLVRHSMKFMLEHMNSFQLPLAENEKKCFRNFNAHSELNGL